MTTEHWNHRILIHKDGTLAVHEVYYDKENNPEMCTKNPVTLCFDDLDELNCMIEKINKASLKPVLKYEDF